MKGHQLIILHQAQRETDKTICGQHYTCCQFASLDSESMTLHADFRRLIGQSAAMLMLLHWFVNYCQLSVNLSVNFVDADGAMKFSKN